MHSAEGGRRTQRRRPDLNINTTVSVNRERDAVPSTPPTKKAPTQSRGKPPVSSRALGAKPPSMSSTTLSRDGDLEESFLDNMTPVDMANKENDPDFMDDRARKSVRDSHDLSLPARQVTRDSLLGNMLQSLDQFSLSQLHTPDTPREPFDGGVSYGLMGEDLTRTMTAVSVSRSSRMHSACNQGHSHSYSSDLDGTDDAASRISSPYSRGRRSNSSSGLQASLGRINSMRETTSQRGNTVTGNRPMHSRGGRTSKSSSTNSIDVGYAQVLSNQRWTQGFGGRSSSFDYGQRPSLVTSPNGNAWTPEFSNSFFADDYEAAPTPTVPAGPRRSPLPTAISPPRFLPQPERKSIDAERNRGLRSGGGTSGMSAESPVLSREMAPPPLPTLDLDSAPAPHIGYEKAKEKETVHGGPISAASLTKERPGFFRRVFGSSSKTQANATPHVPSTPVETSERPSPKVQHIASQMKSSSAPPSRDSQPQQHVLQKKSSFFRRRKKSVAEPPPMPQQPPVTIEAPSPSTDMDLSVEKTKTFEMPEPSPASSLRLAMNPYLRGSAPPTPAGAGGMLTPRREREFVSPQYDVEDREDDRKRKTRGFSPDYDPSPNATIRTVKSQSALITRSHESMVEDTPKMPLKSSIRDPPRTAIERPKPQRDATFFEDSSDTDAGDKVHKRVRNKPLDILGSFPATPTLPPNVKTGSYHTAEENLVNEHLLRTQASPSLLLQPNTSNEEHDKERRESLGLPIQSQQDFIRAPSSTRPRTSPKLQRLSDAEFDEDSDKGRRESLGLPIQSQHGSIKRPSTTNTQSRSAASLPSVKVNTVEPRPKPVGSPLDEPEVTLGKITEDDRHKAKRIFDGNEDFISKDRAAAWMGEEGPLRQRTLQAYMELYDFSDKNVLTSLRQICDRLVLRAETQQIDRILVAFSNRWCACNPNHGFKAMDVIHTMCYSIMLLNTDLHVADIEHKMTRSQFVKNTMTTIKQAVADAQPDAFERPSILPGKNTLLNPGDGDIRNSYDPEKQERPERATWRSSFIAPVRSDCRTGDHGDHEVESCGPLVKAPFNGPIRAWEGQMELVLKDIYASIRDERLPLFGASAEQQGAQHNGGLSVASMLKRSPSVLSKAPSETLSTRGRGHDMNRPNGGRWSSKSRSRPRIGMNGFSSSRTSFEDGNSIWSPTVSSATWSRYSLGRTQTSSLSVDSLGSSYRNGDYQQSIGFANALSQAIIREDDVMGSNQSIMSDDINGSALLDDESLELTGAPWVKEGIVIHKHHLDAKDKKAKDRTWVEVFAVIQKGTLSLFSFSTKSMRNKGRMGRKQAPGAVVGGGNWQENATNLGTFSLRQTLASALPAPGYSRTRPNVWALSLPTGAVHLFQVGTPEISKEFVITVNYWSARLSTHPLVGGISNIEYGWSDACINNALVAAINDNSTLPRPGSSTAGRSSMQYTRTHSRQSSLRSSFDVSGNTRTKLPGDRINISDWQAPQASLRPSNCSEPEQLEALVAYVRSIEGELQKHNQLRSPMLLAFTPRGANATKALTNWENKSQYLLKEIVKFNTYVDCLQFAEQRRAEIYHDRENARRAAIGEDISSEESEGEQDTTLKAE